MCFSIPSSFPPVPLLLYASHDALKISRKILPTESGEKREVSKMLENIDEEIDNMDGQP